MSRIKFEKGYQSRLLLEFKKKTNLSWPELANKFSISKRSLLNWRKEKYTLSNKAFKIILKAIKINLKVRNKYKTLPDYWNIRKAAKKGGLVVAKKYGGPGTPKGRRKGGLKSQMKRRLYPERYKNCNLRKGINIPQNSEKLAEFIGIILGDGGISNDFQVVITLNKENDNGYSLYVANSIKHLFSIKPAFYKLKSKRSRNVISLATSSVALVDFLRKQGIKKGSKIRNQVDVPNWIKNNKKYSIHCLRGLIDTDGGVYYHRYISHGCELLNIGMAFTNKSKPLLSFVKKTFERLKFHPKVSWSGYNIFLYREPEVIRYSEEVGFSNLYQYRRLKKYLELKRKGARAA